MRLEGADKLAHPSDPKNFQYLKGAIGSRPHRGFLHQHQGPFNTSKVRLEVLQLVERVVSLPINFQYLKGAIRGGM